MNAEKSTITLTFGECGENHVGMEKIGTTGTKGTGFSVQFLKDLRKRCEAKGLKCMTSSLAVGLPKGTVAEEAKILVVRNALDTLLGMPKAHEALFAEQAVLDVDKKALMYNRVVNKKARWNLCFADEGHEPNYEDGKGRVVAWSDVPLTQKLRAALTELLGTDDLMGEGNYYYDIKTCGIGYHGDTERRKVAAVRLGCEMPIFWQWYLRNEPVGSKMGLMLGGGDLYFMSEKAVGTDWKESSKLTLRHAAGCPEYTGELPEPRGTA
jgi:hypothetical protein